REGPLELLLCRYYVDETGILRQTKEHESILHAEVDAFDIHTVLMVTGAKPGSPVKYDDMKIIPPTGTKIKIAIQYEKKAGEVETIDAREWSREMPSRQPLAHDWVFAGSAFFKDPDASKKPPYYLANNGDVITIANFADSMLDLPIASTKDNADLAYD